MFGLPKQFNRIGTKQMRKEAPNNAHNAQNYVQTIVYKKSDNVEETHEK